MENPELFHPQPETRPIDDEQRFAVCLRRVRLRLDTKQAWLAGAIGCTDAAVSLWESGARVPSSQSFGRLLTALAEMGVTTSDLLELRRLWVTECAGRRLGRLS
jgi:transcriptional regulator with XRE-family HTH domain